MKTLARFQPQPPASGRSAPSARQRGVVLFLALIVLVILLIGGIVVVRSVNSSLYGAGNLAFRRDLVTQGDAAVARAIQAVSAAGSGASGAIASLHTSQRGANYSASVLQPVGQQGIPVALLNSSFNTVGDPNNDILVNNGADQGGVTIRYLIERMCDQSGPVTADHCVQSLGKYSGAHTGSTNYGTMPMPPGGVIYRLSARVTGPRNTQAFFQTMFSGPN
jgi:Tfp pilus assembly protein PilX